ncbi:metalloregulator ArsR/SmtB family transcription factor [Paenibacillus sp.]|uniref:helix-turn-helix transcriptional regulator n=1 Tax=Paenibacillus sp. TaxID=58172 RepID=UPI002D4B3C32|nr:metalloregulator ArsR/SmtB family transcription factor [Paenibacillus sp.]HZG58888.1 metalloregulator ArsR/SmtB family transcription factor [Paenibacillus sp.]
MDDNNPTTRKQIMTMLRRRGPLNAYDIAKQLGISDIAVRRHLNNLERDRIVGVETVRQAMGRPTFVYSLTEQAEELFPKHYADITLEFLNDVQELQGPEAIEALFERREGRLEQKYKERLGGLSTQGDADELAARVDGLAAIQEERGYMAEWRKEERDGGGARYFITEHNCPIHAIAHSFNQACSSELSLFRKVLDADVEQLECKAKGGQRCVYEVKPKAEP